MIIKRIFLTLFVSTMQASQAPNPDQKLTESPKMDNVKNQKEIAATLAPQQAAAAAKAVAQKKGKPRANSFKGRFIPQIMVPRG